jgi:hypothetical protein
MWSETMTTLSRAVHVFIGASELVLKCLSGCLDESLTLDSGLLLRRTMGAVADRDGDHFCDDQSPPTTRTTPCHGAAFGLSRWCN